MNYYEIIVSKWIYINRFFSASSNRAIPGLPQASLKSAWNHGIFPCFTSQKKTKTPDSWKNPQKNNFKKRNKFLSWGANKFKKKIQPQIQRRPWHLPRVLGLWRRHQAIAGNGRGRRLVLTSEVWGDFDPKKGGKSSRNVYNLDIT